MQNKSKYLFWNTLPLTKAIRALTKELASLHKKHDDNQEDKGEGDKGKTRWTDRWMVYITGALTVATISLYFEAVNQSGISKSSVKIAQDALSYARQKDSEARISDQARFRFDTASTDKQIQTMQNTLTETKIEFEKENAPFLEFEDPKVEKFEKNYPLQMPFSISNLGRYPAKVISAAVVLAIRVNKPEFNEVYEGNLLKDAVNQYITSSKPINEKTFNTRPLTTWQYESLTTGNTFAYIWGYFKYRNLSNGKAAEYDFMIRYDFRMFKYDYLKNDNIYSKP